MIQHMMKHLTFQQNIADQMFFIYTDCFVKMSRTVIKVCSHEKNFTKNSFLLSLCLLFLFVCFELSDLIFC